MVRKHIRKQGARNYKNYTDKKLDDCIRAIKSGALSQRNAAKIYNIPRSTIINKLNNKHTNPVGRPPVLTLEEENVILERVQLLCDYGFPATYRKFSSLCPSASVSFVLP